MYSFVKRKEINFGFWAMTFSVQPTSSNPVIFRAAVQIDGATSLLTLALYYGQHPA